MYLILTTKTFWKVILKISKKVYLFHFKIRKLWILCANFDHLVILIAQKLKKISWGSRSGECTNQIFCHGLFLHVYSSHFLTKMKINSFKFKIFFSGKFQSYKVRDLGCHVFFKSSKWFFIALYIGQKWKLILLTLFFSWKIPVFIKQEIWGITFFSKFFFFFFQFFLFNYRYWQRKTLQNRYKTMN